MKRKITFLLKKIQEKAKQDTNYYSNLFKNLNQYKNDKCIDDLELTSDEISILRSVYESKNK